MTEPSDPLTPAERERLFGEARPRVALPILDAPVQRLPLADEVRAVDRSDRPIYVVWELTLKCDLACRHCGSRAGAKRHDELSLEEALDLVRQMAALGAKEVTLIGGEAYLFEGWTEVVREIRKNGMQSSMVTGGRGWTKERAQAGRSAGLQTLSVSIDGDEATHDRLRGVKGAYRAARQALRNSLAVGLPVSLNSQVNRLSMPHLRHLHEIVLQSGAHGWQIQLTVPAGRAADEPDVLLQPYDLLELFPLLAELKEDCDRRRIKCLLGNNVGYFGPYDHILRNFTLCGHSFSCQAGRLSLGVEANGDIKGCPSLPTATWVGGNIREQSLKDIWERAAALRVNRDRTVKDLWGFCRDCYYADECRGGCSWMSSSIFGRTGNNPYCHHRALDFQQRNQRERIVQVAAAPGSPFDHGKWEIVVEPFEGDQPSSLAEAVHPEASNAETHSVTS
jgi:radical SAM protein with 4Fe4S-binding SPASM domain